MLSRWDVFARIVHILRAVCRPRTHRAWTPAFVQRCDNVLPSQEPHDPPLPTIQPGSHPLHGLLGFSPDDHILSISARDPFDGRDMPANGKDHVAAYCIRGVRKISTQAWADYNAACNPDIVTALSDIPFTSAPHSQKRTTKSLARSTAWLADLLRSTVARRGSPVSDPASSTLSNVLVHMAGGAIAQARKAFAESLMEDIEGIDADRLAPLCRLDDAVAGYVFDLVPLRSALSARQNVNTEEDEEADITTTRQPQAHGVVDSLALASAEGASQVDSAALSECFRASLRPLPAHKPRIANTARSPHEVLRLIRDVGVDLFDAHWAQRAADIGVALDFHFPIVPGLTQPAGEDDTDCPRPKVRPGGKADLGHNLYSTKYANDHSRLASSFLDGQTYERRAAEGLPNLRPTCPCGACSPRNTGSHILHSSVDHMSWNGQEATDGFEPPFMRSYLHHLLHTHEMSAHTLLVMHNLHVLDAFFAGVRWTLECIDAEDFTRQVEWFSEVYDEDMVLFDEAKVDWAKVEMARGKGRLAREKIKQAESCLELGTSVDV